MILKSMLVLPVLAILGSPQAPTSASKAQAIVGALRHGQFDAIEAQYTDAMKTALPPGRLAAAWAGVLTQAGAFQKEMGTREERAGGFNVGIVTCAFERATLDIRVTFDTEGRLAGLSMRPATAALPPYELPAYAVSASFTESDLTIGGVEWRLPGTLALPVGNGPFPAVILIHGSGPADRDETVGAIRPFRDLAAGLASRGVAVLRFEKRTKVYGARLAAVANFTVQDEVVDDAVAAVTAARTNPRIDRARVFVLGHSLGGMLIPRIAAADPSIAGLIVVAGPARSLEVAIVEQMQYLAMTDGSISAEEQKGIDDAKRAADAIRAITPADAAARKTIANAPASYWLDLRGYDPPIAAKAMAQPMLVLQGERDYQVTMEEYARWKAALGSKPKVTLKSYPALNHLMVAGAGRSLPSEYGIPGHVAQEVVDDIAAWVKGGYSPR